MTTTLSTGKKEGFWRSLARALGDFGDALDATEATLLAARVSKLEREVAELKAHRRSTVAPPIRN